MYVLVCELQITLTCMVKLVKSRPHLSQSVVESLLTQLHSAQDAARILMCHCLAAIAMQLPILADGMLGDLMDLYKVIGRSATDKKQELLVRPPSGEQSWMDKAYKLLWMEFYFNFMFLF